MIPKSTSPPPPSSPTDPNLTTLQQLRHIDFPGILTLTSTLVLLLYTLSSPTISYPLLLVSFLSLLFFLLIETRYSSLPLIPPSILRSRANLLSGLATVGIMTARWSILFYTPVFGITILNLSNARAGALLIPTNLGFALGGLLIGAIHIRRTGSFYLPTLICFALFAVLQLSLALQIQDPRPTTESKSTISVPSSPSPSLFSTTLSSPPESFAKRILPHFISTLFLNGFATGALLNYSLAHLLHLTPTSQHLIVIPFNATFRSFSGSFGSAICGGYFLRRLTRNLVVGLEAVGYGMEEGGEGRELVRRLVGRPALVRDEGLEEGVRNVARGAYVDALRALFLAGVVLAVGMGVVQSGVGWAEGREEAEGEGRRKETEGESGGSDGEEADVEGENVEVRRTSAEQRRDAAV